jgi:hypothetical protein
VNRSDIAAEVDIGVPVGLRQPKPGRHSGFRGRQPPPHRTFCDTQPVSGLPYQRRNAPALVTGLPQPVQGGAPLLDASACHWSHLPAHKAQRDRRQSHRRDRDAVNASHPREGTVRWHDPRIRCSRGRSPPGAEVMRRISDG